MESDDDDEEEEESEEEEEEGEDSDCSEEPAGEPAEVGEVAADVPEEFFIRSSTGRRVKCQRLKGKQVIVEEPSKRRKRKEIPSPSHPPHLKDTVIRFRLKDEIHEIDLGADPLQCDDALDDRALRLAPMVYSETVQSSIVAEGLEALPYATMRNVTELWQRIREGSYHMINQGRTIALYREELRRQEGLASDYENALMSLRLERDRIAAEMAGATAEASALREELRRTKEAAEEAAGSSSRQLEELQARLSTLSGPSSLPPDHSRQQFFNSPYYPQLVEELQDQCVAEMIEVLNSYSRLPNGPSTLDEYYYLVVCHESAKNGGSGAPDGGGEG